MDYNLLEEPINYTTSSFAFAGPELKEELQQTVNTIEETM